MLQPSVLATLRFFVCFASLFLCQTCGPGPGSGSVPVSVSVSVSVSGSGNLLNVVSAFTHRRQTIKLLK